MINAVSSASTQAVATPTPVQTKPADSSSNSASAPGNNIGPAVVVSLSGAGKNDMAQGDPDHDGH